MPFGRTRPRAGRRRIVWAWAAGFVVALVLAARVSARGDDAAEGRRHAQRASNLAASGKCRQAVAELDKALAVLRDPALLFNRGECRRKLGDTDGALEDYRQFLSDMPRAPNRAEVERRISELTAKDEQSQEAAVAPPPPGPPAARPAIETADGSREVPAPTPVAPAAPASHPALTLTAPAEFAPPPSSSGDADGGITTRPWFWITIAALAAAAGVTTFVLLSRDSTNIPSTALGNYKF